jgi:hypothetical protein
VIGGRWRIAACPAFTRWMVLWALRKWLMNGILMAI